MRGYRGLHEPRLRCLWRQRRDAIEAPENEGARQNHGSAEIECGGGGAGPFDTGGADKKRDSILIGVARPAIGILARFT